MSTELTFLMFTALLTGLLWIPAVLGQVAARGPLKPDDYVKLPTTPLSDWAIRANRAHLNAVENFSIFAAAVIVAHLANVSTSLTVGASIAYFVARLLHAVVFIAGVKQAMARTLIFTLGWVAFLVIVEEVLRLGAFG